jgi:N-formylglutamate amidohydrolase
MDDAERRAIEAELTPPFSVLLPQRVRVPFVFCSPHSGRVYPKSFLEASRLDARTLRKSEDCYVDELFAGAVSLGAPLIAARFPRAYVDLNREPYELDPELFAEPLPAFANTQSIRVIGGLGTIARVVSETEEIYREKLTVAAALERIERLYKPYHAALARLLDDARRQFGIAVLIDCHSMPSTSAGQPSGARPEFVLGDRFGVSCDGRLTRCVQELLIAAGYTVQINRPYAGGFITEHYGRPARGFHALQVEVNRSLYMNEGTLEPGARFAALRKDLTRILSRLALELPSLLPGGRAAAE